MIHTDMENARRHPIHQPVFQTGNRTAIVFVTVCTDGRRHLLNRPEAVKILIAAWQSAHLWHVGRYVILPDHLHLFCAAAANDPPPLRKWIQYWKAMTTRAWPWPDEKPLWQRDFWDRKLRDEEHYGQRWEYARANPVRHGYVSSPEDWQWQGELNVLRL